MAGTFFWREFGVVKTNYWLDVVWLQELCEGQCGYRLSGVTFTMPSRVKIKTEKFPSYVPRFLSVRPFIQGLVLWGYGLYEVPNPTFHATQAQVIVSSTQVTIKTEV